MRQSLLFCTLAIGSALAQNYNNGQWTTWTSQVVYGTVTVYVTSTVPCPTTSDLWTTTTEVIETTDCPECCEGCTSYTTTTTAIASPTTTYCYGYGTAQMLTTYWGNDGRSTISTLCNGEDIITSSTTPVCPVTTFWGNDGQPTVSNQCGCSSTTFWGNDGQPTVSTLCNGGGIITSSTPNNCIRSTSTITFVPTPGSTVIEVVIPTDCAAQGQITSGNVQVIANEAPQAVSVVYVDGSKASIFAVVAALAVCIML